MNIVGRTASVAAILLALGLVAPQAHAQIISGTITGDVTQVASGVTGIAVGTPVTGTYSYNAGILSNDLIGHMGNPLTAFSLSIGPDTFTLADLLPLLFAQERIPSLSSPPVDSLEFVINFSALSADFGQTVNSQTIVPNLPQSFTCSGANGQILAINFTATQSTSSVPEPGTYALLGSLGLSGAAFLRRRRAR